MKTISVLFLVLLIATFCTEIHAQVGRPGAMQPVAGSRPDVATLTIQVQQDLSRLQFKINAVVPGVLAENGSWQSFETNLNLT